MLKPRQGNINCAEDALIFNQSITSWHMSKKGWDTDQHKLASYPTAIFSKRIQVVICPDVERCLVLWVRYIEEEQKVMVNSTMLMAKHKKFENDLKVPENERTISDGWISKFYKGYMWIISQTWTISDQMCIHSGMVPKSINGMAQWDW